jgi:hypothetical protein
MTLIIELSRVGKLKLHSTTRLTEKPVGGSKLTDLGSEVIQEKITSMRWKFVKFVYVHATARMAVM